MELNPMNLLPCVHTAKPPTAMSLVLYLLNDKILMSLFLACIIRVSSLRS